MPAKSEIAEAEGLGGNRDYIDLRGLTWDEVRAYLKTERYLLPILGESLDESAAVRKYIFETYFEENFEGGDAPATDDAISDYIYDNSFDVQEELLQTLDVGTISTVCALSALGCVPFYSCSGGFGRNHHHAKQPIVAFYARADRCDLLNAAAAAAAVEIECQGGEAVVGTSEIARLCDFAAALLDMHKRIPRNAVPAKGPKKKRRPNGPDQLRLEL